MYHIATSLSLFCTVATLIAGLVVHDMHIERVVLNAFSPLIAAEKYERSSITTQLHTHVHRVTLSKEGRTYKTPDPRETTKYRRHKRSSQGRCRGNGESRVIIPLIDDADLCY